MHVKKKSEYKRWEPSTRYDDHTSLKQLTPCLPIQFHTTYRIHIHQWTEQRACVTRAKTVCQEQYMAMMKLKNLLRSEQPSCLQVTLASKGLHESSHTVPQRLFTQTSTRPCVEELPVPTSLMSPWVQPVQNNFIVNHRKIYSVCLQLIGDGLYFCSGLLSTGYLIKCAVTPSTQNMLHKICITDRLLHGCQQT